MQKPKAKSKFPHTTTVFQPSADTYCKELLTTQLKFGERCFLHIEPKAQNILSPKFRI